ncbi:hypothetical protein [Limnofasciculus baicalensis]|uniref:Uncharacterized protein n=1 Tax=Limnofasciculus baicalensis BBK-W-15 TaxID=2699891 RepID=A0AAE3GUG0_9CYAN|nr:hypothetical protein [Limnofasciculus baicalensis]MCP2730915.1 hypothetical protein [Limnofasciculus baicalensis BBK-W-15]
MLLNRINPFRASLHLGYCDIRVIGPRASGKTTFLATLAYWPYTDGRYPITSVQPMNDETVHLVDTARNILESGSQLEATNFGWHGSSYYNLLINLKPSLCQDPLFWLRQQYLSFSLSCIDYSGELIERLNTNSTDDISISFLDDCALSSGLLLLIDATCRSSDSYYAKAFRILGQELNYRWRKGNRNLKNYRIAIVFSKFDQPEAWEHRNNLEKFININFPRTHNVFNNWYRTCGLSVTYFACSAFGMKGEPPAPNVLVEEGFGAKNGVLADPSKWQPFGLVAPVYWLCTGKNNSWLRDF